MQEKIKTRWVWNEKLQDHQMVEYGTGKYSFTEEDKISIPDFIIFPSKFF